MGYSCSAWASETMENIQKLKCYNSTDEGCYFLERGRENDDGSMTGTVYKIINEGKQCIKSGSYKIDKHGGIVRFPGLSKSLWDSLEVTIEKHFTLMNYLRRKTA